MEKVTHGKMNSRVRGSFLSLEGNQKNSMGKGRKKGKKKKRKKKEKKKRKSIKGGGGRSDPCVEEKIKGLQFPVFRRLEVISPRIKVGLLDESYE